MTRRTGPWNSWVSQEPNAHGPQQRTITDTQTKARKLAASAHICITTQTRALFTSMSQEQGTSGGVDCSSSSSSSSPLSARARQALFDEGFAIRAEVTGIQHVERSWTNASDFSRPMQELATQAGWGLIWGRPGLDRRTRSLLNVAMLVALGKDTELAVHVRGAIKNGATETEIQEAIMQASVYSGLPAGLAGTRVADKALQGLKDDKENKQKGS